MAVTRPWEELFQGDVGIRQLSQAAVPDHTGLACVVWDEEQEAAEPELPEGVPFWAALDADAAQFDFQSQGDRGPYHWAQGPQDNAAVQGQPQQPPKPPATPGQLPRKGEVVVTANLRVRIRPGTEGRVLGVVPAGSRVRLTGGVRLPRGEGRWVRIQYRKPDLAEPVGRLREPDRWIERGGAGWVNAAFLAMPATEFSAADFPPVTHEYTFSVVDGLDVAEATVQEAISAIMGDPRGPLRAGLRIRPAKEGEEPHVLVRLVHNACGGAAGCYYKQAGQTARVDLAREWWATSWFSRIVIHEMAGHASTRCYDHYRSAPDYPRSDYYGIMGNWQDAFGDHAWPDEDDVTNWAEWLRGESAVVMPRRS